MLWFNFILGLNFISIFFKLIIIHYQTPKQRELKFKPRIKYDPQQIYATNYKMWVIFSPESTVRPIFELPYPIKTIRLSLNEFQNGRELRWLCIIFSFKNGKMFIKKKSRPTIYWMMEMSSIRNWMKMEDFVQTDPTKFRDQRVNLNVTFFLVFQNAFL